MVPCSGWESKTCQIWYVLKPQSKTCLSTATPCLLKANTSSEQINSSPLFPHLSPAKREEMLYTSKAEFLPNNASLFRETAGLQLCRHSAHGAEKHRRGQEPLGVCHQRSSTVHCLSASRIKLVVEDLSRGFSMALMALCQLLAVAEHGCFGAAEQGRYVQQREAATLRPAAQAFQGRGVLVACAKTKALWNKSLSNLPSGLPTCVSTQLGIGSGSSSDWKYMCVHRPSAYLGRWAVLWTLLGQLIKPPLAARTHRTSTG